MNNANTLAETLARCGLAMSSSEALRMAESITSTERQVTKNFVEKTGQIENSYTRKKTYQEEIDELIQKTSPEKKNFHYMVRGYKEAENRERRGEDRPFAQKKEVEPVSSPLPAEPVKVYSDALDDERPLNEVMSGEQVCITVKPQEEGVFSELEEPAHDYSKDDGFLMPMEAKKEEPKADLDIKIAEPQRPKEFKNPIPKVDLMGFFKK